MLGAANGGHAPQPEAQRPVSGRSGAKAVGVSALYTRRPDYTEKEIAGIQCVELHVREYDLIVVIKLDDQVAAVLGGVGD